MTYREVAYRRVRTRDRAGEKMMRKKRKKSPIEAILRSGTKRAMPAGS